MQVFYNTLNIDPLKLAELSSEISLNRLKMTHTRWILNKINSEIHFRKRTRSKAIRKQYEFLF